MPAPTVEVTVKIFDAAGGFCPDGTVVTAKLDQTEVYQGFLVPTEVNATTHNGVAVLDLFPNHPVTGLGTRGSIYTIKASPQGMKPLRVTAQIPNNNCTLDQIADLDPVPQLSTALVAQANAAASASLAGASASAAQNYASDANQSQADAEAARDEAVAAQVAADASKAAAATSEANALTSKNAAAASANAADASATAASQSKDTATAMSDNATTKAAAASASATAAHISEQNASASADDAQTRGAAQVALATTQATNAAGSAASALASKNSADQAASTATTQASNATNAANTNAATLNTAYSLLGTVGSITAALAIALGYANTATGQAGLAQSYAASAASVVQQDLSGATLASLHRSPNPVTATFIDDTSKHFDGGAWINKVDASYLGRTLNGAYINASNGVPTEIMARALGGTLGSNLITSNIPSDWTAGLNNTLTANGNGGVRATVSAATPARMNRLFSGIVTPGKTYVVYVVLGTNAPTGGMNIRVGSSTGIFDYVTTNTTLHGGVFRATTADLYIDIYTGANGPNFYVDQYSLIVKEVQSFAPSGSYYPNGTDGKFYRLYRNLMQNPLDFSQASWSKANVTPTYNATANPVDGLVNAALFVDNATNGVHGFTGVPAFTNLPAGGSVYVKAYGNLQRVGLGMENGGGAYAFFDIAGASAGTSTGTSGAMQVPAGVSITSLGSGWYKITNGYNGAASGRLFVYCCQGATNTVAYAGDGLSGFYAYLPHYELSVTSIPGAPEVNGGASQIETFDGNKARYPRLPGYVLEQQRLVIYDLLEPGRPMWMVIGPTNLVDNSNFNCVSAGNGYVLLTSQGNVAGLGLFNFAKDDIRLGSTGPYVNNPALKYRTIKDRLLNTGNALANPALVANGRDGFQIGSIINASAMTFLPDAPLDPVTRLPAPTIALYLASGVALIKQDGSVVTGMTGITFSGGTINPYMITANGSNLYYGLTPGSLAVGFSLTTLTSALPSFSPSALFVASPSTMVAGRGTIAARTSSGAQARMVRVNELNPAASAVLLLADSYNTGWMWGAIGRCLFSDVVSGLVGQELITASADRDFSADTGFWTKPAGVAISGGSCSYTNIVPGGGLQRAGFVSSGQRYKVTFTISAISAGSIAPYVGGTVGTPRTVAGTYTETLTALGDGLLLFRASGSNTTATIDDVSCIEAEVADRSYRGKNASIFGTLTRSLVGAASQLVFWGGWSNTNYVQEAYSSDYDYTSGFALPVWMQVPSTSQNGFATFAGLPYQPTVTQSASFPDASAERITNGDMSSAVGWTVGAGWSIAGGVAQHTAGNTAALSQTGLASSSLWRVIITIGGMTAGNVTIGGNTVQNANTTLSANGTYTMFIAPNSPVLNITPSSTFDGYVDNVSVKEVGPCILVDRSSAGGGANWQIGVDAMGRVVLTVSDGTTTRTYTSTGTFGGTGAVLIEPSLSTSGALTLKVGGEVVGQTTGAPLGSLANATAVVTWGNARTLDRPFVGSIALARPTATIPTEDGSRFMWQQEKGMFRDGAQVTLPDTGALTDLDYDPVEDKWKFTSSVNESTFIGPVRTSTASASAGTFGKVSHRLGVKMLARATTNAGVDVTIPSQNLKEELMRRAEEMARIQTPLAPIEWQGVFTATTINNSAVLTISNLTIPSGATLVGARVSGTNIPAGATITYWNGGTTVHISAPCTGTTVGVTVSMQDVILPAGQAAHIVWTGGTLQREGSAQAWTRGFDGFRERVSYVNVPGNQWLQLATRKAA